MSMTMCRWKTMSALPREAQVVLQMTELLAGGREAGDPHPKCETDDTAHTCHSGGLWGGTDGQSLFAHGRPLGGPRPAGLCGPWAPTSQSRWELVSWASPCLGVGCGGVG